MRMGIVFAVGLRVDGKDKSEAGWATYHLPIHSNSENIAGGEIFFAAHGIQLVRARGGGLGFAACVPNVFGDEGFAQRIGGENFDSIAGIYLVAAFKRDSVADLRLDHAYERAIL